MRKNGQRRRRLHFDLLPAEKDLIKAVAKAEDRSVVGMIRNLIRVRVEDFERERQQKQRRPQPPL